MFVQHHNFGITPTIRCGQSTHKHNSEEHLHQFFELEMVFDGEIEITVDRKTKVARSGDMAIIPAFRTHSFYTPKSVKMLICVFSGYFLSESFSGKLLIQPRESYIFHPSTELWRYLVDSGFSAMKGHYNYDAHKDADKINKLCAIFHLIMADYFAAVPISETRICDDTLSKVLSYMSANFTENLSLESVGAALGYSPKYVSNCLSMIPNINFRKLLNSMRVERAKELLKNTEQSNYEIAVASGFNSECSFHRVFLRQVGCTPGEYRKKMVN